MDTVFGIVAGFLALGLFAMVRSFFRVEEGHRALVESFGRIRRDQEGKAITYGPGMHGKKPWEIAHGFSTMERVLSVREDGREDELLARDGTLLRMNPQVRLRWLPEKAELFLFGIEKPIRHLREFFRSVIATEIAHFGAKNADEGSYAEIRANRGELNGALKKDGAQDFREKYGIEFRAVDVSEILPPVELAEALNSVQKVEAEYETLLKRVRAECEQRMAAASANVEIARMRADASETEISVLGEAVAELREQGMIDSYLRRRRDEVAGNSRTLYLRTE